MDCCLYVYQPYRPLVQFVQDLGYEEQLLPTAWKMVNDSLRTDCALLYPPFQIALGEPLLCETQLLPVATDFHPSCLSCFTACLLMSSVAMQKDVKSWFADLAVDMDKLQEICRYILSFYELIRSYDERKEIQGLLAKMPKPKTQPSRYVNPLSLMISNCTRNLSL